MQKEKRSFFERLTGVINNDDDELEEEIVPLAQRQAAMRNRPEVSMGVQRIEVRDEEWATETAEPEPEEEEEGQLTVDVYQNENDIVVQTMVAGVRPDDLDIALTRETVTIKGKRESPRDVSDDDYAYRELYWGSFSRTITLPAEVETDEAEAIERYGLLTIRLPKIDKHKSSKLKIKSV